MNPAPTPTPDPAPTPTPAAPAFADLGVIFNDATRFLEGGLWQNVVNEGNQGFGSINNYLADLTTIRQGLQAEIAAGQFAGQTLANVNTILADIATAMSAATASVNGGGAFGSIAAAEGALRNSQFDILNIVNNDAYLAGMATNADGVTGFLQVPQLLPDGVTANTAAKGTFAELGLIFNDAANRIIGGLNASNSAIVQADVQALITGLTDLVTANPLQFGGLTGVHVQAVINQLGLTDTYINTAQANVDLGRALNDNFLDMIDVVNNDTNLANLAHQNGLNGWTQFGDFKDPTPAYQDNQLQTDFWAMFIAKSNAIGNAAIAAVNASDQAAIAQVIADLGVFKKDVTDFNAAQGGIFQARFDTELLGDKSTLGAEVAKMVEGLQTGNKALVAAAAAQMHDNAADVGGNNIPVNGGTYDGNATTIAQALAPSGMPAASMSDAATMSNATALPAVMAAMAAAAPAAAVTADSGPSVISIMPYIAAAEQEMSQHHHMWA